MPKVPYPKQIQTFANQIGILKQRGMTFADEAAAEAWLHRVSYYRMSGYWYPLLADRVNHTFKPGATFEQAVSLYEFDSRLRELVFRNIGRIEVAVRTQMAYVMSMAKGGTWFASWLHTLVYVRNICAHHARLWNRTLGVRPLMPRHPRNTFITLPATGTQRVYFVLTIIRYWLNVIDPQNTLTHDLQLLFSKFPSVHAGALGFPQNWEQEQLWQ